MGMNKRGQEASPSGNIVVWVIAAIVLVVIVLAIAGFFGPLGDLFSRYPDSSIVAATCDGYAQGSFANDYCKVPIKITLNGEKQYATCKFLETSGVEWTTKIAECSAVSEADLTAFCVNQKLSMDKKVNGETCKDRTTCVKLEGTLQSACPAGVTEITKASDVTATTKCCPD